MLKLFVSAMVAAVMALVYPEPEQPSSSSPVFECVEQSYEEFKLENPDADYLDYQLYLRLCGIVPNQEMI